jgi:DNA modification methylase
MKSQAKPKATAAGVPVYCAHDAIVDAAALVPNPKNPNTHPDSQIQLLGRIIRQTGWRQPITVSNRSGFIVKGHGRLAAALLEEMQEVPVDYQDYATEAEEYADLVADNRLAELAEIDQKLLADIFADIDTGEIPLELTGYTEEEVGSILDTLSDELIDELAEIEAMEPPETPITQPGDLWVLGRHRLLCGDSTKDTDVDRLMDGEKADMVMTDPPYNVAISNTRGMTIENDDMKPEAFKAFLSEVFKNMNASTKEGGSFYVWFATKERIAFETALRENELIPRQELIWNKNHFKIGRQDYQWKHEPCLYGWKDGSAHYFVDDRKQTTVLEDKKPDFKKMKKEEMVELLEAVYSDKVSTTVIDEDKPLVADLHPTMKPIKLLARLIRNSSKQGELVLDLFGGSGSTLITCDQLNRTNYSMEYDPKYCDVIVRRYMMASGNTAGVRLFRQGRELGQDHYQELIS